MSPAPKWTPPATTDPAPAPDPAPPAVTPPTSTTTVAVTTTTTPAQAAVPWYESMKFRAYMGGWLSLLIGWAVENLSTHKWDFAAYTWIAISVTTLLTLKSVIGDWMSPTVVAPFSAMNKKNVVPPDAP